MERFYEHYKGGLYTIISEGIFVQEHNLLDGQEVYAYQLHNGNFNILTEIQPFNLPYLECKFTEDVDVYTNEPMIIYKDMDNRYWIRPKESFFRYLEEHKRPRFVGYNLYMEGK